MFLRLTRRETDGKAHANWSLVETVRTPGGPRQRTDCYLGELNCSAHARWVDAIAVFTEPGERRQLKFFPAEVAPPVDDPDVARVLVKHVRYERPRQFGACWVCWKLWQQLQLDRLFERLVDTARGEVPWSRVAALLAINRPCAPGSELAMEQRWYPTTALDDLLHIPAGKITDTRLYRCLDHLWRQKTAVERHLTHRFGELFAPSSMCSSTI